MSDQLEPSTSTSTDATPIPAITDSAVTWDRNGPASPESRLQSELDAQGLEPGPRRKLVEEFAGALGRLLAAYERQGIGAAIHQLVLDFAQHGPVSSMTFELVDAELTDAFSTTVSSTIRGIREEDARLLRDGRPLRSIDI